MGKLKKRVIKDSPENSEESGNEDELKNENLDEEVEVDIPKTSQLQRKILLAHKDLEKKGWNNIEMFTMNHPRTGNRSVFLLETRLSDVGPEKFFVFEMLTLTQSTRSWFVDDLVVSDGNWYVSTPFDPLFLIAPILAKSSQAKPFKDHLYDGVPPRVVDIFLKRISSSQLENVSVKKVCGDLEAYLYSEDKCITWLTKKAMKVADFLKIRKINSSEASISSNFSKSLIADQGVDGKDSLRYSCDIIGEYIEETLRKKLLTSLGLPAEPERSKRKNNDSAAEEGQNKKLKVTDHVQPLEDYGSSLSANATAANKSSKGSAKVKELQKAAQGSHSLLKFFTPRSK